MLVDPPLETAARLGTPNDLGEMFVLAMLTPVTQNVYHATARLSVHMDDIPIAAPVRAADALLRTFCNIALNSENPDSAIQSAVLGAFPHLTDALGQFVAMSGEVAQQQSDGVLEFNIGLTLNVKRLQKRYPKLGKLAKRLTKALSISVILCDGEGAAYARLALDASDDTLHIRFALREGAFVTLDEAPLRPGRAIRLAETNNHALKLTGDLHFRMAGFRMAMLGLPVELNCTTSESAPVVAVTLKEMPEAIQASGLVGGIIPIWLLDLVIPSNIDQITNDFFQQLVNGSNNGGMELSAGVLPGHPKEDLNVRFAATIPSNGALRFASGLYAKIAGRDMEIMHELRALIEELLLATRADYELYRSRKRQPEQPSGMTPWGS